VNPAPSAILTQLANRLPWIRRFITMRHPIRRLFRTIVLSAAVGVLSALAAAALHAGLLFGVDQLIGRYVELGSPSWDVFHWQVLLLPAFGGLLFGFITRRHPGQGTDLLVRSFHHQNGRMSFRSATIRGISAVGVISCGGSAGPEGPVAALGASLGSSVGQYFHLPPRDRRILLLSGCAGGVGAIFGCPLGGALFATSVLYQEPEFESDALVSSFIASVVSYSTYMMMWGGGSFLLKGANELSFNGMSELLVYLILGLACGGVAIFFSLSMKFMEGVQERMVSRYRWMLPGLGGLMTGLIACALPQVMDSEYHTIQSALDGSFFDGMSSARDWWVWFVFFGVLVVAKCLATAFTVGSGGSGGLLGPSVFIGGAVGACVGTGMEALFPGVMHESLRAALIPVGMAGILSACVRIPLASMVMIVEMTGSYGLMVPLMLVTMTAYVVGGRFGLMKDQVRSSSQSPAHAGDAVVHMLESIPVSEVMDREWAYSATPSTTLGAMLAMIRSGELPYFVIQDAGKLVGIVSVTDIQDFADEPLMADMAIAADIMTANLYVVDPGDSLYEALTVFRERKVEVLPVVSHGGNGEALGLLSRRKVFRLVASKMEKLRESTLREHAGLGLIEEETQISHLLSGLPVSELRDVQRMPVPVELVGRSLSSANYRRDYGGEVLAIQTEEGPFLCPPDPQRSLCAGDELIVVLSQRHLRRDHD